MSETPTFDLLALLATYAGEAPEARPTPAPPAPRGCTNDSHDIVVRDLRHTANGGTYRRCGCWVHGTDPWMRWS